MVTFLKVPYKLTDTSIASLKAGEQIDAQSGVFVVCRELLLDLPGVAGISARAIVGECFGASELVVRAWSRDDVAVRSDLTSEAFYWAGHCMVLAGVARMIRGGSRELDRGEVVIVPSYCITILTLVDLAEHDNTWELGHGIIGNLRVKGEDAHVAAILGGHIFVRLLDQHVENGGYMLWCVYVGDVTL